MYKYLIYSIICCTFDLLIIHKKNQVMRNHLEEKAARLLEIEAIISILEAEKAEIRTELIQHIVSSGSTFEKIGGITISIRNLSNWTYSKWVTTLEKMLKTRKKNEIENGTAICSKTSTWQFKTK